MTGAALVLGFAVFCMEVAELEGKKPARHPGAILFGCLVWTLLLGSGGYVAEAAIRYLWNAVAG